MGKSYIVNLIGYAQVLVTDCDDEKQAMEIASNEVSSGDLDIEEISVDEEADSQTVARWRKSRPSMVFDDK